MIYRRLYILAIVLWTGLALNQPAAANAPSIGQLTLTQEAELAGAYIAKLSVTPNTNKIDGPGQEITLELQASGLTTAKQVEFIIAVRPPEAFDLDASVFSPADPYLTLGTGVELVDNQLLRLGSVAFVDGNFGDASLGTLNLTLSQEYIPGTIVSVHILFFSIGPSSEEREIYDEAITCLEWFLEPLNTAILASPWGQIKSAFHPGYIR
jgi:hypothetical protein